MKKKNIYILCFTAIILILSLSLGLYYGLPREQASTPGNAPTNLSAGIFNAEGEMTASWQELEADSKISLEEGTIQQCDSSLSGKLVLPEDAEITSIGFQAFKYCIDLEEIVLPEGIVTIEQDAFLSCLNLKKINLPSSVKKIKLDAFYNCPLLEEVTIGEDSTLEEIAYGAFTYCHALKTFDIPSSVTLIDESAFLGCTSLDNIVLPASLTKVSSHLFKDCESLSNINLANVTEIAPYAFYNCKKLTGLDFSKITKIGESAFFGSGLVEISLPEALTVAEKQAFQSCYSLKKAEFKGANTILQDSLFEECSALEEVILPAEIASIPDYLFFGCESLKELTISQHVTWIGRYAFKDCSSLTITFASMANWVYSKTKDFTDYTPITFFTIDDEEEALENKKKLIDGLEENYFKIIDEEVQE